MTVLANTLVYRSNIDDFFNRSDIDFDKLGDEDNKLPPTKKLYENSAYMKEALGKITGVFPQACQVDGITILTFDRSPFFPEGGGQPCDTGFIGDFPVLYVFDKDNVVYHVVKGKAENFTTGKIMNLSIDWNRRFLNMQRHHGEHILSGIFFREYSGINTGFHMGDNYMTIDITLPSDSDYKEITWEMAEHCEYESNKIIWQNLPVVVERFDTKEEAEVFPMRKTLSIENNISLVAIGSLENGWSNVACCGTHPGTTGQVGMLKIFKVEKNKGMFRIYFEAGEAAFLKYQEEMNVLNCLSNKLSSGTEDLLIKYQASENKHREKSNQLYQLKKEIIRREVEEIKTSPILDESGYLIKSYSILEIDDISHIARDAAPYISNLGFFIHAPSNTIFLASDGKTDCNALVKSTASIYNGKGGGNSTLARIILPDSQYVELYIDLVEKHLR